MKRTTKRFFSVLLVLAMLFTLAPMTLINASAEGETGDTGETPSETQTDTITLYVTKTVTQPGTDPGTGETLPAVTEEVKETVTDKSVAQNGDGWSWTPAVKDADGKVTTEGYITLKDFNGTYIESDQSLNIKLDGLNKISGKSFEEELPAEEGKDPETVNRVYGIRVKTGTLTIDKVNSSLTDILTIDLGIVSDAAYGVYIDGPMFLSRVEINGGTVNVLGTQKSDNGIYACGLNFGALNVKNDSNFNVKLIKTGQAAEKDKTNVLLGSGLLFTAATSGTIDIDCTAFPDGITVVQSIMAEHTFSGSMTVKAPSGIGKENAKIGVMNTFRSEAMGTVTFVGSVEFASAIFDQSDYLNNFKVTAPAEYEFKKAESGNYRMFNPLTNEEVTASVISFDVGDEKDLELLDNSFDIPEGKYGETITPISLRTVIKPGTGNGSYSFTIKEGKLPDGLSLTRSGTITGKYAAECAAGKVTVAVISNSKVQELTVNYGKVTVNNPVTSVTVTPVDLPEEPDVGDELTFKATVNPDNADIKTVTWSTSNEDVLELVSTSDKDNTATFEVIGEGTVNVIATSTQGSVASEPYEITAIDSSFYFEYDEDTDAYYIIQFGEKYTGHAGWIEFDDDTWCYVDNEGKLSTGWAQINGKWYYFAGEEDDDIPVFMVTGWQVIGGKWYYFNKWGAMITGWAKLSGKWYYFTQWGKMVTGWAQVSGKWYYFNNSGAMVTGWAQVNGKWYYFNNSGTMITGWAQINRKWYYFNSSGAMVTGWAQISGKWYYMNSSGAMLTGWQQISGKWYYFNANGAMLTGTQRINGKTYKFNSSGVWVA